MTRLPVRRTLLSAIALAAALTAAACQSSRTCDGLRLVHLAPASAVWLVANDRPAAEQIAGNNEMIRGR